MFYKLIIVATLAVGVFGRSVFDAYDPEDPYDEYAEKVAAEYCKASHKEDRKSEVKSSIKSFAICLTGLFETREFERELQEATIGENYDGVIKKYCAKAPQLKECTQNLVVGMAPCLPVETVDQAKKSTNTLIDFVCDNDGVRISSFIKEDGLKCVQEKQLGMAFCQRDMQTNVTKLTNNYGGGMASSFSIPQKERCELLDTGLQCLVDALRECSNPTPGNLAQEFHDVYYESMSCKQEEQNAHIKVQVVQIGSTQSALPCSEENEVDQLKKKKLEIEVRTAELEMWNKENELNVQHTGLTSDIKPLTEEQNAHIKVQVVQIGSTQSALPCSEENEVDQLKKKKLEIEVRTAELEMWNKENELNVQHTGLTSDIKPLTVVKKYL